MFYFRFVFTCNFFKVNYFSFLDMLGLVIHHFWWKEYFAFSQQGVTWISFSWHACGVGWLGVRQPSFSCRKSFCTTDRCVVWNFSQLFLAGKNEDGKKKDCVALDFICLLGREAEYGFSGFITTIKQKYPLSVFNIKLYSQTKCHTDTGKKVMYVSICVCVYACVRMCLCVWTCTPACALCACTRQCK